MLIPRFDPGPLAATLPRDAAYWTPAPEDIDDEGIGCFFRDVWAIVDVDVDEARALLEVERELLAAVDAAAHDEDSFEVAAQCLEKQDIERAGLTAEQVRILKPFVDENDFAPLEGLDLGVAGLVNALAAVGFYPAASCRGHFDPHSWAENPVVLFACTRPQAGTLAPLLASVGGGFALDSARGELLALHTASIEDTVRLAGLILDDLRRWPAREQ